MVFVRGVTLKIYLWCAVFCVVLFITQRIFVCCGFWLFLFPPFPWIHRSFGWEPRNKAATTTYTLKREEYFSYCYYYFSSFAFSFLSHAIRIRFNRAVFFMFFFLSLSLHISFLLDHYCPYSDRTNGNDARNEKKRMFRTIDVEREDRINCQ